MTENMRLWDKLGKTDPSHTKGFKRAGGFAGTAIKPMWSFKRMTEEFGPCGIGWGVNEPSFQVVPGSEGEIMVYCTVSVWYSEEADGEDGGKYRRLNQPVFGVGGDKVVGKNKYGLTSDDEAFKKAYTDAIGNALKLIGVGADVHMGLFDDSKYVQEMRQEFAEEDQPQEKRQTHKERTGQTVEETRPIWKEMADEIANCQSIEELFALWSGTAFKAEYAKLPASWQVEILNAKDVRKEELTGAA